MVHDLLDSASVVVDDVVALRRQLHQHPELGLDEAARFAQVCAATLDEKSHVTLPSPVMGDEDFSMLLQRVPGAMALLGVYPADIADSRDTPPCHSNRMRIDEGGLRHGIALHVAMALDR